MAVSISRQPSIQANIIDSNEQSYSSPLINYVEQDNISGVIKTKFYTQVITNVKVGDWVYIVDGYYDNSKVGKVKSTRKGANGWKVLKVNNCQITLDIDWTGNLPYTEDSWDNFIKIWVANKQEDVDTFVQQSSYEYSGLSSSITTKFDDLKNSVLYLSDSFILDKPFGNSIPTNAGFYKAISGSWSDVTYGFTSGVIPGLTNSNSHILPIDSFTFEDVTYRGGDVFKYDSTLVSQVQTNIPCNGTMILANGGWNSVNAPLPYMATSSYFALSASNILVFESFFDVPESDFGPALVITSSTTLELNSYYKVDFDIVMQQSPFGVDLSVGVGVNYSPNYQATGSYTTYLQCTGTTSLTFRADSYNQGGLVAVDNLVVSKVLTTTGWILDPEYKPAYLGKANFRSGSFSGVWNDGVFGSYDKQINWSNGSWSNGVFVNANMDGTLDSKTDYYTGLKIYYTSLKDGLPKTNLDVNNYFGNGLNYIIDSNLHSGLIKNANIYNSNLVNSQTTSVVYMDVLNQTYSHPSLTMSGGSIYKSNIDSINMNNTKIYNSFVNNTKLKSTKIFDSNVAKSVSDLVEWNSNGYKILNYEYNNVITRPGYVTYTHKFYISESDWLKFSTKSTVSIKDILFNSFYPENIFEKTHFLDWKSLWSRNFDISEGFVLRSNIQNIYNCDVVYNGTYWENSFYTNLIGGFSLDYCATFPINIYSSSDSWKNQQNLTYVNDASVVLDKSIKSIDSAYIYSARYESGVFKNSNWLSGFNTDHDIIMRTFSVASHSTPQISVVGTGGSYSLTAYLQNGSDQYFYKNNIDNELFYLDNLNLFTSSATYSLEGWYSVFTNSVVIHDGYEANLAILKPVTGFLSGTVSFTASGYIDDKIKVSGLVNVNSFKDVYTSKLLITQSNIYSGNFKSTNILSSILINSPLLDNNIEQLNFNKLVLNKLNLQNSGNINNGSVIYSSNVEGIIWNNGILFRSNWNNSTPFENGLSKQSNWVNGTFNNGKLIESNSINASLSDIVIVVDDTYNYAQFAVWYNGTFNNGEFYKSIFFKGVINDGKLWNSQIQSLYGNVDINGGHFGDINIDKSLTTITNNIAASYPNSYYMHFNNGIVDNATLESTIVWYNGVFNNGIITGIDANTTELAPIWYTGIFNNGEFAGNSHWYDGEFKGGKFTSVKFDINNISVPPLMVSGYGTSSLHYSWLSGTFSGGVFGEEDALMKTLEPYIGIPYRSSWKNGVFLGGKFVGRVWNDGVFINGEFEGSITQSITSNRISATDLLYNGDFNYSITGGFTELLISNEYYIDSSNRFRFLMLGAQETLSTTKSLVTLLQPGKRYKVVITVALSGNIYGDAQYVSVTLGNSESTRYFGIGIFESEVTCGVGGEVYLNCYMDNSSPTGQVTYVDSVAIYEVIGQNNISIGDVIDHYSPEYQNNWRGIFRTGSVVDSLKKTTGVYSMNNLPAGSPLLKEGYKTNNPVKFSNMIFVNGTFDNTLASVNNSIWLDGRFNNGIFNASHFNPYVKRWDYLDWTGVVTVSNTLAPYNGSFTQSIGLWPSVSGNNPPGRYATFSLVPSDKLTYDGEFESVGLSVTSSAISLTEYTNYDVSFDITDYIQPFNTLLIRFYLGDAISSPFYGTGSYTFSLVCFGGTSFVIEAYDPDQFYGTLSIDNLVIQSASYSSLPYSYNLDTQSCVWNNGILDQGSEFSISEWNNGLFKMGSMFGARFNKGTSYYMNAYNTIWMDGRWRNGNWYGSDIIFSTYSVSAPYPQNRYVLFDNKVSGATSSTYSVMPGAYNDQITMNMIRNNSENVHIWNLFTETPVKKSYYSPLNNTEITSNISLYTQTTQSIDTLDGIKLIKGFDLLNQFRFLNNHNFSAVSTDMTIGGSETIGERTYTKLGNGSFKKGTWEQGIWNNGTRIETAFNYTKPFLKFRDVYIAYEINPTLWQVILSPTKSEYDNFVANNYIYNGLELGDDITIGNIVLIDINGDRKVHHGKTKIIEFDLDNGNIIFNISTKFPLRSIERDSKYHLMYVTRNIWLGGTFLHGNFSGVWSNGNVLGWPSLTQFTASHWIDGQMEGIWFKSSVDSYSASFGITTSNYNTSLVQNGFIENKSTALSYINTLDFVYGSNSTSNQSMTYNRLTSEDVLSIDMRDYSTIQPGSWGNLITYKFGTKYKVYDYLIPKNISEVIVSGTGVSPSSIGWNLNDVSGLTHSNILSIQDGDGSSDPYLMVGSTNFIPNYNLSFTISNIGSTSIGLVNDNNIISNFRYSKVSYDLINIGTYINPINTYIGPWNKNYDIMNSSTNNISTLTGSYAHYSFGQTTKQPILMTRNFDGRIDNIYYQELDRIPLPSFYNLGFTDKIYNNFNLSRPYTLTASVINFNDNTD